MFNLASLRIFIVFFDVELTLLMEDVLYVGHQLAFDYIQLLNFFQKKKSGVNVCLVSVSLSVLHTCQIKLKVFCFQNMMCGTFFFL
jgi:hypothetical protein